MLDPNNACRVPLSSHLALLSALLLAGTFGLLATLLLPSMAPGESEASARGRNPSQDAAPGQIELPPGMPEAAPTEELVRFCSQHVSKQRSFVLFPQGTCVIVDEPCEDAVAEACERLADCASADARFVSELTSDGDLIVAFDKPVFHRFTREQLQEITPWLGENTALLHGPSKNATDENAASSRLDDRIGLLARKHLLEDASNAVPVRIVRAESLAD